MVLKYKMKTFKNITFAKIKRHSKRKENAFSICQFLKAFHKIKQNKSKTEVFNSLKLYCLHHQNLSGNKSKIS